MEAMIIECNVWCNGSTQEEINLGLPVGDSWMPMAIDFRSIEAIKLCGPTEFLGDDKATIYFQNEVITIDITFKKAIELWKKAKP